MDRMREFLSIVGLTDIAQNSFQEPDFFIDVSQIEQEIESTLTTLSKLTTYEQFKVQALVNKASGLLKEYRSIQVPDERGSRDYTEVLSNLKSMMNTKYLKYTLRVNEAKRKMQRPAPEQQAPTTTRAAGGSGGNMALLMTEEQAQEQKDEFIEERKRIVKSINEIGQIVEDISIHVRLQEEQLRRVDDIVQESDKWSKKALGELNEVWHIVRLYRKSIVKFFVFWAFVILFFWVLRKV